MICRRGFLVAAGAVLGVGVAGSCGSEEPSGPPEIHYGRDVCAECHMIISEARFAAAFRDRRGETVAFDDIGDMVAFLRSSGSAGQVTAWVHDYGTERWTKASTATYVEGGTSLSPMAHNTVAWSRRSDAESFREEHGGELSTWRALMSEAGDAVPDERESN